MRSMQFSYRYEEQDIPYSIWFSDDSSSVENIVFLGTVQVGKLPEWVAKKCPPKTAIVQGAPHWYAKPDGSDIPSYMFGYSVASFQALLSVRDVRPSAVVADSQAAPGTILLFGRSEYKQYMSKLALVQPLGLTAHIYNGSDEDRMTLFKQRIIKNSYHQLTSLLTDSRLRYNYRMLSRFTGHSDPKTMAQYSSGLKHDSRTELKELLAINPSVSIISGSRDKIFPIAEIRQSLDMADIRLGIISVQGVPHSPLASRKGSKLLEKAFKELRT